MAREAGQQVICERAGNCIRFPASRDDPADERPGRAMPLDVDGSEFAWHMDLGPARCSSLPLLFRNHEAETLQSLVVYDRVA